MLRLMPFLKTDVAAAAVSFLYWKRVFQDQLCAFQCLRRRQAAGGQLWYGRCLLEGRVISRRLAPRSNHIHLSLSLPTSHLSTRERSLRKPQKSRKKTQKSRGKNVKSHSNVVWLHLPLHSPCPPETCPHKNHHIVHF